MKMKTHEYTVVHSMADIPSPAQGTNSKPAPTEAQEDPVNRDPLYAKMDDESIVVNWALQSTNPRVKMLVTSYMDTLDPVIFTILNKEYMRDSQRGQVTIDISKMQLRALESHMTLQALLLANTHKEFRDMYPDAYKLLIRKMTLQLDTVTKQLQLQGTEVKLDEANNIAKTYVLDGVKNV